MERLDKIGRTFVHEVRGEEGGIRGGSWKRLVTAADGRGGAAGTRQEFLSQEDFVEKENLVILLGGPHGRSKRVGALDGPGP